MTISILTSTLHVASPERLAEEVGLGAPAGLDLENLPLRDDERDEESDSEDYDSELPGYPAFPGPDEPEPDDDPEDFDLESRSAASAGPGVRTLR